MSLLHQDSSELDDAARGESFTRGTGHVVWASVAAAVVVTAVIAVYVITGQKPPVAAGEIVSVWAVPQHIETKGFDAGGATIPKSTFDQVLVFAQVRLRNQSRQPIFLTNAMSNAALDDGIHSSYAGSASAYDRIFLAYPGIAVPHGKALALDATIGAGQSVEGTIVSAFRLTKQQWDARKDLSFTFTFRYQPNLTIAPHAAVIEQ